MRLSYHFEEQFFDNRNNAIRHTLVNRLVTNLTLTTPLLEQILAMPDNRFTKIHAYRSAGDPVRETVPFPTINFLTKLWVATRRIQAGTLQFRDDEGILKLMKLNSCLTFVRKNAYRFTQPDSIAPNVPVFYITALQFVLKDAGINHSPYDPEHTINSVRLSYQIKRLEKWKQIYREESPFYDQLEAYGRGQVRSLLPQRIMVGAALDMLTDDWDDVSRRLKRAGIHPSWKFLYLLMNCYGVPKNIDDARIILNTALPLDTECDAFNAYLFRRPTMSKLLLDFVRTDTLLPTMSHEDWYGAILKENRSVVG